MISLFLYFSLLCLSLSMKVTLSLSSSTLHQQQHSSPQLCYMGDLGTGHVQFQLLGEGIEEEEHMNMEVEFWPLEHPMEPLDEDRPIKCPMDESSLINDGAMHKEHQHGESSWKRRTQHHSSPPGGRGGRGRRVTVATDTQQPRALRKRQHTLTTGDHTPIPLQMLPSVLNPYIEPNDS